ncbi:hypothetical protein HER39_05245, partial [Arthrobacter deserti]|nr:hypothetical protein [Arthrobacter deserti]
MGMFDKLVNKGKKMALNYAKEQLSRRTGQQRSPGGAAGYGQGAGYGAQYPSQGRQPPGRWPDSGQQAGGQVQGTEADRQAIAKYRYMLRTAPPEDM